MKAIELSIQESPCGIDVDSEGQSTFDLYTSNACDGEFEEAMATLVQIWGLETEVSLTIKMSTRAIFQEMLDYCGTCDGEVDAEDMLKFMALKRDCEWIIEQVNKIKEIK